MPNDFLAELLRRLPQTALGIAAGRQGGPLAAGAFQQGMLQRQQFEEERARRAQLDEERRRQWDAQEAHAQSAEVRATEAADLQRRQALMAALSQYDADPAALARFYTVPAEQVQAMAAPILSARKARKIRQIAKDKLAEVSKVFGNEVTTGQRAARFTDSTLAELLGPAYPSEGLTVQDLLRYAELQATAPSGEPIAPLAGKPDVPNTLEERIADALKRGDAADVERLKTAAELISGARRDPQMTEINRQLAELRLDQARAAKNSGALPPQTQRRVDIKTRAFDAQPVVKRIQTMAEAVTFADGLDPNTTNPADDQAIIYAFAKAMDPDSVVREGEYAVVQKYAQSWAERFGFEAARIFSNTQFLTPQARQNMKATIRARFAAAKPQYENIRRSYATQISRLTGHGDGEDYLIDYAAAFPSGGPAGRGSQPTGTAGATYDEYLRSREPR